MYTKGECNCYIRAVFDKAEKMEIVHCPKHEAAPDMYEALKDCITSMQSARLCGAENLEGAIIVAQIARAKADGK